MGIYKTLLCGDSFNNNHFDKAFIPLNARSSIKSEYVINEDGIPCCPNDSTLLMKSEGITTTKAGIKTVSYTHLRAHET